MPQSPSPPEPTLVDSHVHLDRYPDPTVRLLLDRAAMVGVTRLLTVGVDLDSSVAALRLAGEYPAVLAAIGIHPTRLADLAATTDPLASLRGLLSGPADTGQARPHAI